MMKIKIIKCLVVVFGLFFLLTPQLIKAFNFVVTCEPTPLTTFSDGNSTFDVSFPPGGGTTCSTIANCPTISLPEDSVIYSMKVDMELTIPGSEIGTPYIWVPRTSSNQISQLRTSNASVVKTYGVISNPSRVTVMPGGDVWTASRTSSGVSRLSPLMGGGAAGGFCGDSICGSDENIYSCSVDCAGNVCGTAATSNCEEYSVTGTYTASGAAKGITYGSDGNIYVADYNSATITKFAYSGGAIIQSNFANPLPYYRVYGMIGDPFGNIWMIAGDSGGVNRRVVYFDTSTNTFSTASSCTLNGSNYLYGIGMDNEGNILANNYGGGGTCKIGGFNSSSLGSIITTYVGPAGSRGVAVDSNNNVWVSNSMNNNVYVYSSAGTLLKTITTGYTDVLGVAIDFDDNAWVASNGSGYITQYGAVGSVGEYTVLNNRSMGGGAPKLYNYSDMTGLRTIPKTITFGSVTIPTTTSTTTFDICSGICNPASPSPCTSLSGITSCSPSAIGSCAIPLEIFSMQAGNYTLKNLEVVYGKQTPVTTGGLVPCGRDWDDPATAWNDTAPCEVCHGILLMNQGMNFLIQLAGVVSVLALIVVGFLYITSAGDPERKNLAKSSLKWVIIGFIIIFLAWLMVDFLLSAWGYLDPMGGKWSVICD